MNPAAPPAPAERLASIIDLLCRIVAAQIAGRRLAGPLIILICSRLRRIAARFAGIAARLQSGRLRRRSASPPRPAQPATRPNRPDRKRPLPHGFAWLVRLVPQAAAGASQLQYLLAEPDMAALIAAAPQAGRSLRALCWMLGVRPPPGVKPARRAPPAAPDPPASPAAAGPPPRTAAPPIQPPPSRASPPPSPLPPFGACGPPVRA